MIPDPLESLLDVIVAAEVALDRKEPAAGPGSLGFF
jgi:hypothetical protein